MNIVWMLLAGLCLSSVGVLVKLGAGQFTSMEMVFYRCVIGLVFLSAIMWIRGHKVRWTNPRGHLSRGLSGVAAMSLFFHALTVLPLATATTLNYTSPLFLALLSIFWLKEKALPVQFVVLCMGFLGVVMLLGPTISRSQLPDALLGLTSGLCAGVAIMNVRALGRAGEPAWNVVFFFSLISSIVSTSWVLLHAMHRLTPGNVWIVVGIGVLSTLGQLFLTKAFQAGQTLVTGVFNYSTLIFASFFGIILWGENLSLLAWCGMVVLIASGVLMVRLSARPVPRQVAAGG